LQQDPGIMVYPGQGSGDDGFEGDHIIIAPPFTITADDIELIVEGTKSAIDAVFNKLAEK
jgi:adenosylmethionine-8-amino-7-oxononanoate aminotransferase